MEKIDKILRNHDILGYYVDGNKVNISLHYKSNASSIINDIIQNCEYKEIIHRQTKIVIVR